MSIISLSSEVFRQLNDKSSEVKAVIFLDGENAMIEDVIFSPLQLALAIGLKESDLDKIYFVAVYGHGRYFNRITKIKEDNPINTFFVYAATQIKNAADYHIIHLSSGLHFILPITIPFVFVSGDRFTDEISHNLSQLNRKVYVNPFHIRTPLKPLILYETPKQELNGLTDALSNLNLPRDPTEIPDNLEELTQDDLRQLFKQYWIESERRSLRSFSKEYQIEQSNLSKWVNGKKSSQIIADSIRRWIKSFVEQQKT